MMKTTNHISNKSHLPVWCAMAALLAAGCSDDLLRFDNEQGDGSEMRISGSIEQQYTTRAFDGGFADGDAIGVYVVDHERGVPGELKATGNHATNVKFRYNESEDTWTGAASLYWTDDTTPVDAFSYYPFVEHIDDVQSLKHQIATRQDVANSLSGISGYEASDFLWAKASAVTPGKVIRLDHVHVMSSIQVTLVAGEDFGSSWEELEKSVSIDNTLTETTVDLTDGAVRTVAGTESKSITPYCKEDTYRAIVAPQTIESGTSLLSITVNGDGYRFKRNTSTTYQPGKLHKFTIRVDKRLSGDYQFTLVDETISEWETDQVSHNAESKAYTVIDVPQPGMLEEMVRQRGINPKEIANLKLTGVMTQSDFEFLKRNFSYITALNLKEIRTKEILVDCPGDYVPKDMQEGQHPYDDALPEWMVGRDDAIMQNLNHIILPDQLKYVANYALANAPLSGTIIFPEGVEYIGMGCIGAYQSELHHIRTLILPSSLVYIGREAFNGVDFSNELKLPDKVEYIGWLAFCGCDETYGEARLPANLKYLGDGAFSGTPLTGTVIFPAGMTRIPSAFSNTRITGIYIPEGTEEIALGAFEGSSSLTGDIHLPNSIRKIGRSAFAGTKITSINIPTSMEEIPRDMLNGCKNLTGVLTIPDNIRRIYRGAFVDCANLQAIELPATLETIGGDNSDVSWLGGSTFGGCYSLEYLRCDAVVPPTLVEDVFSDLESQLHKDNFTLVVPEGSVEAYQNAQWWKEFKRISAYRNLVFRPQLAKALNKGGSRNVVLNANANTNWSVTHCPSWLHMSAQTGKGKTELKVTIDPLARGNGDRIDEIRVKLDGTDYETAFKVSQFDYEYDEDQSYTMQQHTTGAGVKLVIVGDGYDAEDIATGNYINDMQLAAEQFFDLEPFKTYRGYFDVYTAFAMSPESGIGSVNYLRESKFSTRYGTGNYDNRIGAATDYVATYCLDNTPVTSAEFGRMTCILVANGEQYDGITVMYDNGTAVAICPKSTAAYPNDMRGLVQHEGCGHAFTKLADEYMYHREYLELCTCACCNHADGLRAMQASGWGLNLSLSARHADLPWKHLLEDQRTSDIVDIWEGGWYHAGGVFRSEYNSVMNHNEPYMSTWCRELAVRRIKEYAGLQYDFEDFISKDSREWGRDFTIGTRASRQSVISEAPMRGTFPIIIKGAPRCNYKGIRSSSHNHK